MPSSIKGSFPSKVSPPSKVLSYRKFSSINLSLDAKFPSEIFGGGRLHVAKDMLHGLLRICCMGCRGYVALVAKDMLSCDSGKPKSTSILKT